MNSIEFPAGGAAQHKQLSEDRDGGATFIACMIKVLHLGATPVFAMMALLTGLGDDPMSQICSIGSGSLLTGMLPMYLLMSIFHSPPWLRLITDR